MPERFQHAADHSHSHDARALSAPRPLAVLYEHPQWFRPLFAALERRGVDFEALPTGAWFDPAAEAPARVVLNRLAMSAFLREPEHPVFWGLGLLSHYERMGARVINGSRALAIDTSKANQLSLLANLGLAVPRTLVVHRRAELAAAAEAVGFPVLVKANIGGAGAGIVRYDQRDELGAAIADGTVPGSIDGVLLVQEYVPARGGASIRLETLDKSFLYALEVEGGGQFDLCPADACTIETGIRLKAVQPDYPIIAAAEAIARAAHLDLGGVEFLIDDRDGTPRFYDINALSNYVANPLDVLGWDPHDRLVDRLIGWIKEVS